MTERVFQFVPIRLIGAFYCRGWWVVDWMTTCHHGEYSVIMERRP